MGNISRYKSYGQKVCEVLNHYLEGKEDLKLMSLRTSEDLLRQRVDQTHTQLPEVCRKADTGTTLIRQRRVLEHMNLPS